jgi:polyisoprenoid-binding protein YceI
VSSATAEATATSQPPVFHLIPEESEARFIIDEVLGGKLNTVVATSREVAGEIHVDPAVPDQAVVGPIRIQLGRLATDNGFRDRALRTFILQTSDFPEVVFAPTSPAGLPAEAVLGEPFTFTLTGDLTIRHITRSVTFTVTVTPESSERLTGTASARISRADYELTIPTVRNVADVSEVVLLELDFAGTQ